MVRWLTVHVRKVTRDTAATAAEAAALSEDEAAALAEAEAEAEAAIAAALADELAPAPAARVKPDGPRRPTAKVMNYCHHCGAKLMSSRSLYCNTCGKPLTEVTRS